MIKKFSPVAADPRYSWKHTSTLMRFITYASSQTIKKMREAPPTPIRIKLDGAEVISAIFEGSDNKGLDFGEEFYLTQVDLWSRQCTCDCKKFEFSDRNEPCKHVVSTVIEALKTKEFTSASTSEIIDAAAADDRFIGGHRMPWEWKSEFDHDVAKAYNFRVERTFIHNKVMTCYREMLKSDDGVARPGKIWRGPLPLPESGELLDVKLPQVDGVVEVEVLERADSDIYIGFLCRFTGKIPDGYPSNRLSVFGADVTRKMRP